MNWLTLKINPPEKIEALVAKKESKFGFGSDYKIFNLDKDRHCIDELVMCIQSEGFTKWKYLEIYETCKCKGCKSIFESSEITKDGYCESCQYMHEANLDNSTDK